MPTKIDYFSETLKKYATKLNEYHESFGMSNGIVSYQEYKNILKDRHQHREDSQD